VQRRERQVDADGAADIDHRHQLAAAHQVIGFGRELGQALGHLRRHRELHDQRLQHWCGWQDSNPRPLGS
jgi:hypothetical protein